MKNITILASLVLVVLIMPSLTRAHEERPTMCTMQYAPVCGTEKGVYKTYGNGCVLAAEGAVHQHEGECTAAELKGEGTAEAYVPPAHCVAWNDGCNSCGRGTNGESFCTLMACMGEPRAGYCTAYADTETPEPVKPSPGTSGSSGVSSGPVAPANPEAFVYVEATSTATTSDEVQVGFFSRIWASISSWFGNIF